MLETSRAALGQLRYWPRAWSLIWSAAPRQTLIWVALLLVQGLLPLAIIWTSKLLVDALVAAIRSAHAVDYIPQLLLLAGLGGGALLLTEVFQSLSEWLRTSQSELVQDAIKQRIHHQAGRLDMAFYDSPAYHDLMEQARGDAAGRPLALLDSLGNLLQNGVTLMSVAFILIPYGPWLPLALLVGMLPALYVVVRFNRWEHAWWKRTTVDRRRAQYYESMLTHPGVTGELRLFGLEHHFRTAYQALRLCLRDERLGRLQRQVLARLAAGAGALLVPAIVMAWMIWRALQGSATLGDLVLFYQAFQRGQGLMRVLLGSLGQIFSNSLFLGSLFEFLDLEPQLTDPSHPIEPPQQLRDGIRFRNVSFRYPGSDRFALRNFDLDLRSNSVVAIVGANGAGKSTLIKLLCRFYDPDSGSIELDGTDLRRLSLAGLRRLLTVLFQFPVPYHETVARNLTLGNVTANPTAADVERAARRAGAHEFISRMPRGYETHLGRTFEDGVELSGGEWQRIAMGRAFLRPASIILLDEPTSFMDSWAEADWFERLSELAADRTCLIITHRFTIAARADIIHVMDQGRIVESGTHQQLLAAGGLYAQSWRKQMRAAMSAEDDVPQDGAADARQEPVFAST